uniref:DUF3078 domain-containing protein n=2 Tax=Flavobacterium sp. TaxID=239 RepID=UPI0040497CB9
MHSKSKSTMQIRLLFLIIFGVFMTAKSYAQPTIRTEKEKDTSYWQHKNVINFDLTQIAFSNWNAGGNSSISGLLRGTFQKKYVRNKVLWNNELLTRYGINKQEGRELRKTDDQFVLNSNFGYKHSKKSDWYYSGRFNFTSQFVEGYAYPNKEIAISFPLAPAYIFLGIGAEYNLKEKEFNVYMSPLTLKTTLVLNQRLANQGAFGVRPAAFDEFGNLISEGKRNRTEMGILINNYWKKEVYKNIIFENRVVLFGDYINKVGNIDVDWQMQLDMQVNEFVKANITVHMIYDDDTKAKEEIDGEQVTVGPKLQLKQGLGIGVVYQF